MLNSNDFGNNYVELALEINEIYKELGMKEKGKGYLKLVINQFQEDYKIDLKTKIKTAYNKSNIC